MKIKNFSLFVLIILIVCCPSRAQDTTLTSPCDCKETFKEIIVKLEANYIGIPLGQLPEEKARYEERKTLFREKAKTITPEHCTQFLSAFLNYFDDGHLFVFERPKYTNSRRDSIKQSIKKNKVSLPTLKHYVDNNAATKTDPFLGIWTDGTSKFVVTKKNDSYYVYILESILDSVEPGQLKAKLNFEDNHYIGSFYTNNYVPWFIEGGIYKEGTLFVASSIFWQKVADPLDVITLDVDTNFKLPTIKHINNETVLITIPSFSVDFTLFNDIINAHEKELKKATTIIIDIRGNRGGNGVYFNLIEFFATNDMKGSQGLVLASEDNLKYFEHSAKNYSSKVYTPVVDSIIKNMGKIVDGPLYPGVAYDIKKTAIANVAILTDGACMSAAESFILHAKASSNKVTTFGSPTDGVIDYTSVNSLPLKNSGTQNIYFGYPTSTLHKEIPNNGYNSTGIIPDIEIDTTSTNKIQYIVDYYKRNKK